MERALHIAQGGRRALERDAVKASERVVPDVDLVPLIRLQPVRPEKVYFVVDDEHAAARELNRVLLNRVDSREIA